MSALQQNPDRAYIPSASLQAKIAMSGRWSRAAWRPGIRLGEIALRDERGVLQIGAADMLRLRWNPFYPFVQQRLLSFFSLDGQHSANRAFGDFPPTQ